MTDKKTTYIFIVVSIVLNAIGAVLFTTYPVLGIFLIFIGIIGAFTSVFISRSQNKHLSDMLDIQAKLFAKSGIGNPYLESIENELKKKGFVKTSKEFLLRAYESNPNDADVLSNVLPSILINLSFENFILHSKIDLEEVTFLKDLIKKGKELSPESSVFYEANGILLDIEGLHKQARREFRTAGQFREDPYWRLLIATSYHMSGHHEKALIEMKISIDEGAQGYLADYYLGRAFLSVGKYEKALPLLKKSKISFNSNLEINTHLKECYYLMGYMARAGLYDISIALSFLMFGKLFAAISRLLEGLSHIFISFLCIASKILWKITKRNNALRSFHEKKCAPIEPEFTISRLLLNKGHFDQAKLMLTKTLNYCPSNWRIWNNLSIVLWQLGEKDEALKACDKSIYLNPTSDMLKRNREQIEAFSPTKKARFIDESQLPKEFVTKD